MAKRSGPHKLTPFHALAVVGVVGLVGGTLRKSATELERPEPRYREFALVEQKSGLTATGSGQVPQLEYRFTVPSSHRGLLAAFLVGGDGRRLSLRQSGFTDDICSFIRVGYPRPLDAPHLVVESDGRKVLDQPVSPMLPAIRAIPLIVPLDPDIELTPTKATSLAKELFGSSAISLTFRNRMPTSYTNLISRTEWGIDSIGGMVNPQTKEVSFSFVTDNLGGLAEYVKADEIVTRLEREFDLDVELFEQNGQPAIRIVKPVRVAFPDGTAFRFHLRERIPTPAKRKRLLRILAISGTEETGHPPFILPNPAARRATVVAVAMELVSPSLASLGLSQLSLGRFTLHDAEAPKGLVAYGRHRLRLRVGCTLREMIERRRFVRIVP